MHRPTLPAPDRAFARDTGGTIAPTAAWFRDLDLSLGTAGNTVHWAGKENRVDKKAHEESFGPIFYSKPLAIRSFTVSKFTLQQEH
jgi:hypothetical protein